MTRRRELVGPGLVLIVFGAWPWVLATFWPLLRMRRSPSLPVVASVAACVGLVAAHLAVAIWVLEVMRQRKARRAADAAPAGPLRPDRESGPAATVARVATLVTVLTLWGPFGIAMLSPFGAPGPVVGLDRGWSWAFAILTWLGLALGLGLVARGAFGRPPGAPPRRTT